MAKINLKLKNLEFRVRHIVGFELVVKFGYKLDDEEIKTIAEYLEEKHNLGNSEYVACVLIRGGRPFFLLDPTFTRKCNTCGTLVNYCCCQM